MKKLITFSLLLLLIPAISFAAFDDVTLTTDTIINVGGFNLNVHGSSSVIESITVDTNSFDVTLLSNSSFSVSSAVSAGFAVNVAGASATSTITCGTPSVLTLVPGSGTSIVTVTPSPTCTPTSTTSVSSSGSRSNSSLNTVPLTDCLVGHLFSSSTGLPCNSNAIPTVCPVGHLFNTTTGLPCTSYQINPILECTIINTLRQGSIGEEVKCLQTSLKNLVIDGIFGPKTKAAVILFQKNHPPLVPDGIFGPKSKDAWEKSQFAF